MSTSPATEIDATVALQPRRATGDYFFSGVMVMLAINVIQRFVGLARSLGFCHFLNDEQLGAWAMANSFFVFIIPLAMLGLTGSFGRFVEHYRRKQQLGDYLATVLCVVTVGVAAVISWLLFAPANFAWLVFNESLSPWIVGWCLVTVLSLVLFTIVYEVTAALREVRAMSLMQFVQSTAFAVGGLAVLAVVNDWSLLLPCYSIACLLACIPGGWVLWCRYRGELRPTGTMEMSPMWRRILPFATGLWILNLLSNLLGSADRYMLLHLSLSPDAGQSAVGQYHCSMVIPNLMLSVGMMLGGVVLPFIASDWEAGDRQRVASGLRQVLKSLSMGFIGLGVAALVVSPWLFDIAFAGRYEAARQVVPLALAQAVWVSLFLVAQTYFLCMEKTRTLIAVQLFGLLLNLVLNWVLIQQYGLTGAVLATAISSLVSLVMLHRLMAVEGCDLGKTSLILYLVPGVLIAGPIASLLMIGALIALSGRTNWILTQQDRADLDDALLPKLAKLGVRISTLWP